MTLHLKPVTNEAAHARLVSAETMPRPAFHAFYGRQGAGLLAYILDENGRPRFWNNWSPIGNPITGFTAFDTPVDYGDPQSLAHRHHPVCWQGPNLNLARTVSRPAEEQLARAIRTPDERWPAGKSISASLANRIVDVLVTAAIENAVPPTIDGRLVVTRLFPPSIRGGLAAGLIGDDEVSERRAQTLFQFPALALFPMALAIAPGIKLKYLAADIGLPKQAARIKPAALSPVIHWMRTAERDASVSLDLSWLNVDLCKALDHRTGWQRCVLDVGCQLAIRGYDAGEITAFARWLNKSIVLLKLGQINHGFRRLLVDYFRCDAETASAMRVQKWHAHLPISSAIENAVLLQDRLKEWRDETKTLPFAPPRWALADQMLPGTRWTMVRLKTESDLIREGHDAQSCVASYAPDCRSGRSVIYTFRRPATKADHSFVFNGQKLGATIELINRRGGLQIAQLYGPLNRPAPQSIRDGLNRLFQNMEKMKNG